MIKIAIFEPQLEILAPAINSCNEQYKEHTLCLVYDSQLIG